MTVQDQLYNKADGEYYNFIQECKLLESKGLIRKAHEIVVKEILLEVLGESHLDDAQAEVLLQIDSLLDKTYLDMINCNFDLIKEHQSQCFEMMSTEMLDEMKEYAGKYKIIDKIAVGDTIFALAYCHEAEKPYSTWTGHKSRPGRFDWGNFFDSHDAAKDNLQNRVDKKQKYIEANNRDSSGR